MSEQEQTPVVSSFVRRHVGGLPDGKDVVLLARRSQKVRTYRGAWAAISGYLEPGVTPLEQAYTELREETGLGRDDVRLLRVGEPVAFRDESIGQNWVVHPFLFDLVTNKEVVHDWEAKEFRWFPPDALNSLETVPMLREALARVYPPDAGG